MSIGNRINRLRIKAKLTQQKLANAIGSSGASVNRWEKGINIPSSGMIEGLCKALNTTPEYLLYGTEPTDAVPSIDSLPVAEMPILGATQAGGWREMITDLDTKTVSVPSHLMKEGRFAVCVIGDSMQPTVPEGALVIIDPAAEALLHDKIYLVQDGNGGSTIKRVKLDGNTVHLAPDNPRYGGAFTPLEGGVIGRVIAFMGEL